MQPWMIIAGLVGAGVLVLLVAPTIHRRINARSRSQAEEGRRSRATQLRTSETGRERLFPDATAAVRLRDALLLRGVRVELVRESGGVVLVYDRDDEETVLAAIEEAESG